MLRIVNGWAEHVFKLDDVDPNTLGEFLREWAFKKDGYGCYSTFDLEDGWEKLPEKTEYIKNFWEEDYSVIWNNFIHLETGIKMSYMWDGDGTLIFELPSGRIIRNTDCKCSYGWEDKDG